MIHKIIKSLAGILVLILAFLLNICNLNAQKKIEKTVYKYSKKDKLDEAELYCSELKGEEQMYCYSLLASRYYSKKNYDKAKEYYTKCGKEKVYYENRGDKYLYDFKYSFSCSCSVWSSRS